MRESIFDFMATFGTLSRVHKSAFQKSFKKVFFKTKVVDIEKYALCMYVYEV